jgi:hypothetical protein
MSNNIIILYGVSYLSMFTLGFLLNHAMIIKGEYFSRSPKKGAFYAIFGAVGILVSTFTRRFFSENIKAYIAIIACVLVSFLVLLAAANCFLRWYYIIRYKV